MQPKRLYVALSRVRRFLTKYGEPYGSVIAEMESLLSDQPDALKEGIRKLFGAMGSLSDIYICKDNGHDVKHKKGTNLELGAILDVLWEEIKDPDRDQTPVSAMHLVKLRPMTHGEAEDAFAKADLETVIDTLVWITFFDPDWRWSQDWCLSFTHHGNSYLRGLAASCLVDLANIHGTLDIGKVSIRLGELLSDSEVKDRVEDALVGVNTALNILH